MVAPAVGLMALGFTASGFLSSLSARNEDIAGKLETETDAVRNPVDQHVRDVDRYSTAPDEAWAALPALRGQVEQQQVEINKLLGRVG